MTYTLIARVASASNPDRPPYEVKWDGSRLTCPCMRWIRHVEDDGTRSCRHTAEVQRRLSRLGLTVEQAIRAGGLERAAAEWGRPGPATAVRRGAQGEARRQRQVVPAVRPSGSPETAATASGRPIGRSASAEMARRIADAAVRQADVAQTASEVRETRNRRAAEARILSSLQRPRCVMPGCQDVAEPSVQLCRAHVEAVGRVAMGLSPVAPVEEDTSWFGGGRAITLRE